MNLAEIELAIDWAAAEGWNPGLGDAACFYSADPEGFFIAILDGKPVGSVAAVRYGDGFGFIGLFIVRPEFRGRRLGVNLGKAALAHLEGRNIGLDGVLKKVANYETFGFNYAYKNIRFEGRGSGAINQRATSLCANFEFSEISAYDAKMFGCARPAFLHTWLDQQNAISLGINRAGALAGYGVIRKCRIGYKIGPLFADDIAIAEELLNALASHANGELYYLDVPKPNESAIKLVQDRKMKEVFATVRMYSRSPPALPLEHIFGVTTFELG